MLRLNRSALDQAMRRPPDKRGEEGNIRFIGAKPEEQLALKEWYDNQRLRNIETAERGRLPLSPYFAKLSFYEAKLIHDVSPTNTIEVVGAYDPRVQGDQFNAAADYPVTVSRRVIGDPEQQREYDAIIDKAYGVFLPIHAQRRHGLSYTFEDTVAISEARTNADQQIRERFGSTITGPWQDKAITSSNEAVTDMLENANKIDPTGSIAGLLELGIVPGHPEFNFIPGSPETHPKAPHGTFVENHIVDADRLQQRLNAKAALAMDLNEQATVAEQKRLLQRFKLFKQLDTDYYNCLLDVPQHIIDNPAVQRAVFEMLQAKFTFLRYNSIPIAIYAFSPDFFQLKNTANKNAEAFIDLCHGMTRVIEHDTITPLFTHWINHLPRLHAVTLGDPSDPQASLLRRFGQARFAVNAQQFFQDTELQNMMRELRNNDPDNNPNFITGLTRIIERMETLVK